MTELGLEEIVELSAVDGEFYTKQFFPRLARQDSPPFHQTCWRLLDSHDRMVNLQVFRGGAKTSLLRSFTSKRIAYNISRTILYIGKSEGHAIRSINWIKNQVETNRYWADTFQLSPGTKWQDTEANISHGIEEDGIWLMGMGITGSIRGINRDDFRPDLIVLDDVISDENAGTDEQREKITDLIYGAVKESLAPRSEAPDAKMVMLQTPIHQRDASCLALEDREWKSAVFGCFTPETANAPTHMQQSAWPARWSNEELQREKAAMLARNKSSVWYREKECKLIAPETVAFRTNWLKFYNSIQLPEYGARVLIVDPVPPPSDKEIEQGFIKKDYECLHVVQRTGSKYYSVKYEMNRGHDPSWTLAKLFELAEKYRVRKILVESVAYQRTLAWLMRQAMQQRGRYWQVVEFTDQRSKFTKIVDSLNGVASEGQLYVLKDQTDLIQQFTDYPRVSHDDVLETLALGVMELSGLGYDQEMFGDEVINSENYVPLDAMYGAP